MSLLQEFRRRKVVRVAAAYLVVGWLLVQVAATVLPALQLPPWTVTFTTVLLLLGFPVALLLGWSFDVVRTRPNPVVAAEQAIATPTTRGGLVVLPFANMSDDAELTHFADGFVEDLTTRLQAIGLKVHSRQSAFAYRGRPADARTIARELGCQHVVEGSVRKLGDRLRLTVQLIEARSDEHVWAERYDRQLTDVFELQDQISEQVVAAVGERLLNGGPDVATPASDETLAGSTARATVSPAQPALRIASGMRSVAGLAAIAVALIVLAAALTWTAQKRSQERWAREEALPELEMLIEAGDHDGAFDLAGRIAQVTPGDPRLKALGPEYAAAVTLRTLPSPAKVWYRSYSGGEDSWRLVGETPLESVPMPRGYGLWKFEAPGRLTTIHAMRNPGAQLRSESETATMEWFVDMDLTVQLAEATAASEASVFVPATKLPVPYVSGAFVDLPAYYIDRLETTNRQYKEFVDAGGYGEAAYWQDLSFGDGRDWRAEVRKFVDATGRPGPATWEAGTFKGGSEDEPVSGLSWFEAAAYARFRGRELPTAYHWYRAALSLREGLESMLVPVMEHANFSGQGPVTVGTSGSVGAFGALDMAGNVREWLWTATGQGRWIAGGGWNQPSYMAVQRDAASPYDRSPINGVRTMRSSLGGPMPAALREPITIMEPTDYTSLRPSSDELYRALARQFDYAPLTTAGRVRTMPSSNPVWRHEQVSLPAGYEEQSFNVQLFLPTDARPPFPVVVYAPHSGYRSGLVNSASFDPAATSTPPLDFVVKSGRALAVIAFDDLFERAWTADRRAALDPAELQRLRLRHMRQDLGRTLDYIGSRADLDADRIGWYGVSYGAAGMVPLIALEPRIRAAVLNGGGIARSELPPDEQQFNYLPRITQPVLMLNGRWDFVFPVASQEAMFRLLGTPADQKQHLLFDEGHGVLPLRPVISATLDFFERHLGSNGT